MFDFDAAVDAVAQALARETMTGNYARLLAEARYIAGEMFVGDAADVEAVAVAAAERWRGAGA